MLIPRPQAGQTPILPIARRVQTVLVEVSGAGSGALQGMGLEAYSDSTGDAESNGDAACWLGQVCPECGAMIEAELPAACWRCGELVQRD